MKHRELCTRCGTVTDSRIVQHSSGTEFLCAVCGKQTDFLHDEWDADELVEEFYELEDMGEFDD